MFAPIFSLGYLLLILQNFVCAFTHQKPGMKVRLSQKALNTMVEESRKRDRTGEPFPDIGGVIETYYGDILYNLTDSRIIAISLISLKVELVESVNGLKFTLSNASISLAANLACGTRKKKLANGIVKIKAKQIDLELVVKVDSDNDNIAVSFHKCFMKIKNLDIEYEGPNGGLYNLTDDLLKKQFQTPCIMIENALQKAKIPIKLQTEFTSRLDMELSFTEVPIIKKEYVEINLKGQFLAKNAFRIYPFQAADIIVDNEEDRMLNIWLTTYLLDTLLNVFYKTDKLKIGKKDYPVNFQKHFASSCWNRTCIGFFFPALELLYPKSFIEIEVKASETPRIHVMNEYVRIYFKNATTTFYVDDIPIKELFIFSLNLLVHVNLSLSNNTLYWKITKHFLSVKLIKTSIGPIAEMLISNAVEFIFNKAMLEWLNKFGKEGQKLKPPPRLNLENATLRMNHGNILLQTDFKFSN